MRRTNHSFGPFRGSDAPIEGDDTLRERLHARADAWKERITSFGSRPSLEAALLTELLEIAGLRGCDRFAKLGARMQPTNAEPAPGQSRLGGWPDLPRGARWPEDPDGMSLAFLAQVRLREVPTGVFPRRSDAMISFFYDTYGQPRGHDPGDRARFAVRIDAVNDLVRVTPPLVSERGSAVTFAPRLTLPAAGSFEMAHLDGSERDRWAAVVNAFEEVRLHPPEHQFGGHPQLLGAPLDGAPLHESEPWRLLFQIDSEPARGWSWDDGGRLYVMLREDHLLEGSGERAWVFVD